MNAVNSHQLLYMYSETPSVDLARVHNPQRLAPYMYFDVLTTELHLQYINKNNNNNIYLALQNSQSFTILHSNLTFKLHAV